MLEIKNLYTGYDKKEIIKNINLNVKRGENLCIVGPNGCYMSTHLNTIANIIKYNVKFYVLRKEIKTGNDEAGGWALSGTTPDPDITAMALQSLAPYKDDKKVAPFIERALATLSKIQKENGGYASWGTVNSESVAQVIVALLSI